MRKKENTKNIPGVKRFTVGKGFTERRKYQIDLNETLSPEALKLLKSGPKGKTPFDGKITPVEASARRILENAGLPTDPRKGNTFSLIKAGGYRERIDQEWYAAEILLLAHYIRGTMADGVGDDGRLSQGIAWTVLSLAADLGELVGEAKARGFFAQVGPEGKKPEKIPEIKTYVRTRLRKNHKLTSAALFRQIPREQFDAIPIGSAAKIFINGSRLCVMRRQGKDWRLAESLEYSSFRDYMTEARKAILSR